MNVTYTGDVNSPPPFKPGDIIQGKYTNNFYYVSSLPVKGTDPINRTVDIILTNLHTGESQYGYSESGHINVPVSEIKLAHKEK